MSSPSPLVSPLSGTLSTLGQEVVKRKLQLLSQLVTKTTSFTKEDIRTEENFDIALDFALYNLDHHSFLDCDPHETDALYDTLERRLELNSCLQKRSDLCEGRKRLRRACENERNGKNKDDDDDLVQLVRDPCHRILSLLYWLSGNPVNPAETPSSTQETPTTKKKVEEDRHAEAPTGQEGGDEWTVSDEIALCDSASELSDWSEDDLGGELVDEGEIAAERAPSGGTGAGPLGSPAVLVEVEEGRPGRGGPAPLAGVRAAAEASERHAIRRHLLLLRGDGLAGAAAAQDTGSSHPSGLGGNVARAAVALADAVGSLRLAPRDGLPPCSTLSAFHASVDRQLSRHSSWCRSLEERSLRGRGGELTMIELAGEIEAQAASVSHLTAAREEVEEATRTATSTCECAALVLTALWRLWRRSSLDVSPRVGEGGFDPARLARDLFTSSSRPYLRMLEEYLNEGRVRDPRGEFFISSASSSAESGQEGAYWRQGHRVRGPAPSFLAAEAESILLSGKALGVLGARGVPGPELRIPLLGNEDRPGPAEPMGSAGEAGQAGAGASGRAGGVEKMAAATEAIVEFRWRFRGEEGPESPNSILCALPDDSEPALGSAADLRAALFGGDRGWRRRRPAQGSAAGSQEELGGEGSSDLCPPEEILDSLVLDPVRTRCAAVEHRLLAALRSRHNLVCQLELLKDVYLHASAAEIGGFLKLAFDLTAREGFVDENAELSEAFREANRRGGREGELLSSMVARLNSRGSRTLAISYEATWPLSLLVDETSIAGYNSVFGAVTKALNAQHHLQKVWRKGRGLRPAAVRVVWCDQKVDFLRRDFAHFANAYRQYLFDQVEGANWRECRAKLEAGETTLEGLRAAHEAFLSECASRCLVEEKGFARCLRLALEFCRVCGEMAEGAAGAEEVRADEWSRRLEALRLDFDEGRSYLLTVLGSKLRLGHGAGSHLAELVSLLRGQNAFYDA